MQNNNLVVTNEELLISNMLEIQAIIRILKRRKITTIDELFEEIQNLQVEMDAMIRKMSAEN